jgi:hypothetical protein
VSQVGFENKDEWILARLKMIVHIKMEIFYIHDDQIVFSKIVGNEIKINIIHSLLGLYL